MLTPPRILTFWQVVWFSVTEFSRVAQGLPMNPLELTALSFVFDMIGSGMGWFYKPSPVKPRFISTRSSVSIAEIRNYTKQHTHTNLEKDRYRTPLAFIDGPRFQLAVHWAFYQEIAHRLRINPARRMKSKPWDHFPADIWQPIELWAIPPGSIVQLFMSVIFVSAWNFYFPTRPEQTTWRVISLAHVLCRLYGGLCYLYATLKWHYRK
jgi:hypothetical protein